MSHLKRVRSWMGYVQLAWLSLSQRIAARRTDVKENHSQKVNDSLPPVVVAEAPVDPSRREARSRENTERAVVDIFAMMDLESSSTPSGQSESGALLSVDGNETRPESSKSGIFAPEVVSPVSAEAAPEPKTTPKPTPPPAPVKTQAPVPPPIAAKPTPPPVAPKPAAPPVAAKTTTPLAPPKPTAPPVVSKPAAPPVAAKTTTPLAPPKPITPPVAAKPPATPVVAKPEPPQDTKSSAPTTVPPKAPVAKPETPPQTVKPQVVQANGNGAKSNGNSNGNAAAAESNGKYNPNNLNEQTAQRLARLLVSEIKLYYKSKTEGVELTENIYDLLKEPIDKSRQHYRQRMGKAAMESMPDYFHGELVKTLCAGDASRLGPNYQA